MRYKGYMLKQVLVGLMVAAACGADNKAERLEWFRDQGFGMFIHYSMDSQLGVVISHSMAAADDAYLKRFVEELPKTFHPRKFAPGDWAVLAKLAGMKYVVFTTKHHSGFCMWDTRTTPFQIMNTPFRRDMTRELMDAFRARGIAAGMYFSPDDFWWLYKNGKTIQRGVPDVQPVNNPGLMQHDQAQVRELMTRYGKIDVMFFDGDAGGLKEVAWQAQPDVVVTRGVIQTPEQYIPGIPLDGVWEANLTMGREWNYMPANDVYKSGGQLISMLVETRAKGGNLLLNVGPKPDGELPIEQEERLREVGLWMFVNGEAIYGVRPWVVTNEKDYWFTRKKDEDTLYVVIKEKERWNYGEWKEIVLKSVRAGEGTMASVLSQNDKVVEYRPDILPTTTWRQEADGLHVRANNALRLYTDRKWPNPVVLKLTNVKPALTPPRVETTGARWDRASRMATFEGELKTLGNAASLELAFEYRDITGQDVNERGENWTAVSVGVRSAAGAFKAEVRDLTAGRDYEVRAVVRHPLLTLYGMEKRVSAR